MNEILLKRIEEAAKRYSWSHDTIGVDKETFHTEASQKHPIPIDKHVRVPIQHEMEVAFKCAAHFILNNQWISVEEALPDKGHDVLVAVLNTKTNTYFYGFDAIVDDSVFLRDKNGFSIEVDYHKITHWMPIPQQEGGEK